MDNPTGTTQGATPKANTVAPPAPTADGADGNDSSEAAGQVFANLIQQISSEQAPASKESKAMAGLGQGLFSAFHTVNASVAAISVSGMPIMPPGPPAATTANKKEAPKPALANSVPAVTLLQAKLPQDMPAIPVDIVSPPPPPLPKPGELTSASAGAQAPQIHAQPAHPAASPPEAALTVAIRTEGPSPLTHPAEPAQAPGNAIASADFANAADDVAAEVPAQTGDINYLQTATAAENGIAYAQNLAPTPGNAYEDVTPAATLSSGTVTERRKTTAAAASADAVTEAPKSLAPQTTAFQDLQPKTDSPKSAENSAPRSEAPRPLSPAEPPMPEKAATPPVRSLALEFAPDGLRDVKVRLSERAGEVHISVHSADPATTKDLRSGVADLASVLTSAGYDAQAWTSGRQQPDTPQQQENPPQRRNSQADAGAESFDGFLQNPNQENS